MNKKIKILQIPANLLFVFLVNNCWCLTFYDLGENASYPVAVSGDGSLVVGSHAGGAFKWTVENGLQGLSMNYATGISSDGSTIVGANNVRAFRLQNENYQNLGTFSDYANFSWADGVNYNGDTVVGESAYSNGDRRAFVWRQGQGLLDIGTLTGSGWSRARSVSHNGEVVVGISTPSSGNTSSDRAFLWTQAGGLLNLGTLPGMNRSDANFVSGDGSTVVGYSNFWNNSGGSDASRAFRWNSGVMEDLGVLSGGNHSYAYGVSEDGSIIVGSSDSSISTRAFIWRATDGMVDLTSYLESQGLNLNNFILREAYAVSSDGSTVVGYGTYDGSIAMRCYRDWETDRKSVV